MTEKNVQIKFTDRKDTYDNRNLLHIGVLDPALSDGALRTYHTYLMLVLRNDGCVPSREAVAQMRGVPRIEISRHIVELLNAGYVTLKEYPRSKAITESDDIENIDWLESISTNGCNEREIDLYGGSQIKESEENLYEGEITNKKLNDFLELKGILMYLNWKSRNVSEDWRFPTNNDLLKKAFKATNTEYFPTRLERYRWLLIEKAMMPLDRSGMVEYPTQWIEWCIEWVKVRNEHYADKDPEKIASFEYLLSTIENPENKYGWVEEVLRTNRIPEATYIDNDEK